MMKLNPAIEATRSTDTAEDRGNAADNYKQILNSSALVGGSSIVNIVIGIVRTKAIAILLGPAGFGIYGIYAAIATLAQTLAGMGINTSGVRQIAYATASEGSSCQVAVTVVAVRRASVVSALLGAALLAALSWPLSFLTFGNGQTAVSISLLSFAVMFQVISNGQIALLQGMRRVKDFAKVSAYGALVGTAIGLPVIYVMRQGGIVLSLVAVAMGSSFFSWLYSRKIQIDKSKLMAHDLTKEFSSLLKLGSAFLASGLVTIGAGYAARIIVLRNIGADATGLYQAAWTLGGVYVGFILQAMGADFFPRLTAVIEDHDRCNRLVNEQMRIGMLLAGPGVIISISLAPAVISIFYSGRFLPAVGALRWICVGALLQVITWPISYILAAKGKQTFYLLSEIAWGVTNITLTWVCAKRFGVTGTGVAFFASYVFYFVILAPIVTKLTGFKVSAANVRTALLFFAAIAIVLGALYSLPLRSTLAVGIVVPILSSIYSIRVLSNLTGWRGMRRT